MSNYVFKVGDQYAKALAERDDWKARAEKAEADLAEIATAWRSPNLAPDQMEEAVERILADYWNAE